MPHPESTPDPPLPDPRPFDGTPEEWDAAVARLEGTFCHLWGWGEVFRSVFGHDAHRWVDRDAEGAIRGLLPAVLMRSPLFGRNLVSMPFLNYGGALGESTSREALTRAAVAFGREAGARLVEIRDRVPVETGFPVSREKVTVLLPLPDDAETLWTDGLKGKVRSQVRRPRKAGMTAAVGLAGMDDFYDVFARNMRDLGTPVLPRRLFHAIAETFPEEAVVCLVESDGQPVAGGCGFLYRGEFELTWASSLREHSREAPNMLLYWTLMEAMIERGATTFNFGRCSPGGGTHRFKLQWGGEDEQLHWTRWSPGGDGAPPSAEGGLYQTAISMWQKLPLPVANALGPLISRGLPTW